MAALGELHVVWIERERAESQSSSLLHSTETTALRCLRDRERQYMAALGELHVVWIEGEEGGQSDI